MIKIVQIGTGMFANFTHGPMLKKYLDEHPGAIELAAVCVRRDVDRAKEYCRNHGFGRVYTDIDEMIRTELPDACWVTTPVEVTRKVAGKMMELGIPVLFEKPHGKTLREAEELCEVARRTGTPNMVAFNRRFTTCTEMAKGWLGQHGPFERMHVRMLRTHRDDPVFAFETGIHVLDCIQWLGAEYLGGLQRARTHKQEALAGHFNYHIELEFGSGGTGTCDLLPNSGSVEESFELCGDNKRVYFRLPWRNVDSVAELWVDGKIVESETWPSETALLNLGIYQEAAAFIESIRNGRAPWPSAEETLSSIALAEAVQDGRDWTAAEA